MSKPTSAARHALSALFLGLGMIVNVHATTVWTGPDTVFTKPDGADWTLAENQDRLTDNVWLTRGNAQGLFNIAQEVSFSRPVSPVDTEWAFLGLNGNSNDSAEITAANYEDLEFRAFTVALEGRSNLQTNIVDRPGVLHLISDDIYLDIEFSDWGSNGVGGFSYVRATVPLPPALLLFASAITGLGILVRRRRVS